jgi:hypothetical protein
MVGPHRLTLPPDAPPVVFLPADVDIAFGFPPEPDRRLFAEVYD